MTNKRAIKEIRECFYDEMESLLEDFNNGEINYDEYRRYYKNIVDNFENEMAELDQ